jgi:hypothetical protein
MPDPTDQEFRKLVGLPYVSENENGSCPDVVADNETSKYSQASTDIIPKAFVDVVDQKLPIYFESAHQAIISKKDRSYFVENQKISVIDYRSSGEIQV